MIRVVFGLGVMFIAVGLFAIFAPVRFLNLVTPSFGYRLQKNITYGNLPRQKLDIYTPKHGIDTAPVLVFVYGGGWHSGRKAMYKFIGDAFTAEGYIVAIADYRLYPEVRYPRFVEDSAKAVADIARRYPDRSLILIGHSAGAYNAALLVTNKDYLERQGINICDRLAGFIGLAGPYGALPATDEPYVSIFPHRLMADEAPLSYIGGDEPPMFLAIGERDMTVSDTHSRQLADAVNQAGGRAAGQVGSQVGKKAEFHLYPALNHRDMLKVLSRYFDGRSTLKRDMFKFIEAHSHQKSASCPRD